MKKFFEKVLLLFMAFITLSFSIPVSGNAESVSSCNYYLVGRDFERNYFGFISSQNISYPQSPKDAESHGKVVKKEFDGVGDSFLSHYSVLENAYTFGDLEVLKVSFDIMYDGYIETSAGFHIGTKPVSQIDYKVYCGATTTRGRRYIDSRYQTTAAFEKYKTYELNTWYNYKYELNLKEDTISFWINDELIYGDQDIWVIYGDKNTEKIRHTNNIASFRMDIIRDQTLIDSNNALADGTPKVVRNLYVDNFNYYVPYGDVYDGDSIELAVKRNGEGNEVTAKATIVDNPRGILVAARYTGDVLQNVDLIEAENTNDALIAAFTQSIDKGDLYRFFLLERVETIKPLIPDVGYKSYVEEDYRQVERKWKEYIVGSSGRSDSDMIREKVANILKAGKSEYETLSGRISEAEKSGKTLYDLKYLWDSSWESNKDLTLIYEYADIYRIALACAVPDSELSADERADMIALVKDALEWMYRNRYSSDAATEQVWIPYIKGGTYNGDWWNWLVGAPEYLIDTLMILRDEFSQEEINKYLEFPKQLLDGRVNKFTKLADVLEMAYNNLGLGVLARDEVILYEIINSYPRLFEFVTSGIGFYEDGSFLYHANTPYTGMYGTDAFLDRTVAVMGITNGTAFQFPEYTNERYMYLANEAFGPLMYEGGMMNMVRGRFVDYTSEAADGARVIASMIDMLDSVSDEDARNLKEFINRQCQNPSGRNAVYSNLELGHAIKLEKVLEEMETATIEPYSDSKVFYNMDRVVHQRPSWSAGLAMSSERISNYESNYDRNCNGWYNGDGMMYLYISPDNQQYNPNYFKYSDPFKRPGTTEDSQPRVSKKISVENGYFPEGSFVGGVSMDDLYSVGVMDFVAFHNTKAETAASHPVHYSDLTAKKSWFMFDNEIVCLGTDITQTVAGKEGDTNQYNVYTTVENRKVTDNALTVDGENIPYGTSSVPTTGEVSNAVWAHIEGTGGYFFPMNEESDYDTTLNYRQIENENNDFFEMWFDHGVKPSGRKYAYALLPTMTKSQTQIYAQNPDFEILENSSSVHAVCHKTLGITGYVFWSEGSFDGISVSEPVLVMKKENGDIVDLCFSDPSHKLTGTLSITLDGEYTKLTADNGISVNGNGINTDITFKMDGSCGKTLNVRLQKCK